MSADLSVIIPTYKRTDSLARLLSLLMKQENIVLEIIVVDQNSEAYFDDDMQLLLNKVLWIKQPVPNASTARNRGFLAASADHVLFIDDDLVPGTDFCKKGMEVFSTYPAIHSFVPLVYTEAGEEQSVKEAKIKQVSNYAGQDVIFAITDTISAAVFFKKHYFIESGGFDELLFQFAKTAEDQEFFLRMYRKGMQLWFVPTVKVFHDERVAGGCDLRTEDYWITREKCMKAWAIRYRTISHDGSIKPGDFLRLLRSCVINLAVLKSGPSYISKQLRLMQMAISESGQFFNVHRADYKNKIDKGFLSPV
ncbi:MAG TPA: glycosyltransferase [Chitinophagaceae bacterium]|nr:glycosyltransferase [Chitinophagaceae bacterium]